MMLKALIEKRSALIAEMEALVAALSSAKDGKTEVRAFTDDEKIAYDKKKEEVERLTATINAVREERGKEINIPVDDDKQGEKSDVDTETEERMFLDYIRGRSKELETRADSNFTASENGAVIPSSIANKIIEKIQEMSPVFRLATKYEIGGTLNIPYYDEESGEITMAYADEFQELQSTSGKFKSIQLSGFLAGALCKVSKKLLNNSKFDLLGYIVKKTAESAVRWIEGELLNGTVDKIEGLSSVTQVIPAASAVAVTADELIDLQEEVPDEYQTDAIWIMSKNTRKAIRKLKDGDGNYLLQKDATSRWGYVLFGKDVYIAKKMPDMESGKRAILYGDFSGLAVKIAENPTVEVLRELFATQHAVGVSVFMEMDSKIENAQKIAALDMATA
ncbi:MAG: phage major capsid protein [Ruminococcaceae bacterium]|nr:phage major capsid protein [Oscillospiraceae bacterium]